ncbi:MAG: histidine kinase [Flammeovirgaceae bacterium]
METFVENQKQNGFYLDKSKLYWICQLGGWSLYGFYMMLTLFISERLTLQSAADVVFTCSCLLLLSHFYRKFIVKQGWLKLLFGKLLLMMIPASILLSVMAIPFSWLSSLLFDPERLESEFTQGGILQAILGGTFLFFSWSLGYFLYHYVSNYNRSLKFEAMMNEFELNRLRSQLNPHFIFNALNSVKVLVDENPQTAKESIDQLSNILRNSLVMDKKKVISFSEELAIVKDYLALEKTRFEERLKIEYDIDEASLNFKVPPMMIQTLVENGLKHGISKLKHGGLISLTTKVEGNDLWIEIRNSGTYQPSPNSSAREGYGIRSTIQRLELLYRKKASFQIGETEENMVLVKLKIPSWDESELVVNAV